MKRIFIVLLSVFVSTALISCKDKSANYTFVENSSSFITNSCSNIRNKGLVASKDNFVFLVNGNNIDKINKLTGESSVLVEDKNDLSYLTIDDDYLYYVDTVIDKANINRINLKNEKTSTVLSTKYNIRDLISYKDSLYYVSDNSGCSLCKINKSEIGDNEITPQIISKNDYQDFDFLNIFNGEFYFVSHDIEDSICKMPLDNDHKESIYLDRKINNLIINDNNITYSKFEHDYVSVYKLDPYGKSKSKLFNIIPFKGDSISNIKSISWNLDNNDIYYVSQDDDNINIYKYDIEKDAKSVLYNIDTENPNEYINNINIFDDYIYYQKNQNIISNVGIAKKDGSLNTNLYNDKNIVIPK